MPEPLNPLVLYNRHTGERLELTRFESDDGLWLELKGSLPPRAEGPLLHIHVNEDEGGRVVAGTISAIVSGRKSGSHQEVRSRYPKASRIGGGMKATSSLSSKASPSR